MSEKRVQELKKQRDLLEKQLIDASKEVDETRAQGDLSENAGYEAAVENFQHISSELRDLESKLSSCTVIAKSSPGIIGYGDSIRIQRIGHGDKELVVTLEESGVPSIDGILGVNSPLGKQIYNTSGGLVSVMTNSGEIQYKVKKIEEVSQIA
jgi:transcription elongation factor GreA